MRRDCPGCGGLVAAHRITCMVCWRTFPMSARVAYVKASRRRERAPDEYREAVALMLWLCRERRAVLMDEERKGTTFDALAF